ncbi:hypothetical protein BV394_03150 [Brevirhabdus pacifica]|uniref:Uncharacterized protein n=2 Tax=Brevirhabdus pacifica TaxID=1267768 RepID=A0A1U7DG43_9RHOB|nr:hypothetical protein BV394_03150 [Brevirhabdus pacifica]OWU80085.1 hypothetical protein ATO5_03835 [Loktanella sp. 22II-4b]PJJ86612.1 hypothetical protein CLV77_1164 [Brevirhabdus pacifica]
MSTSFTGDRIRERRMQRGIKQTELSRRVGISASYLNLIEHNRRNIGGKLLLSLADALGVAASSLSEGADEELLDTLRDAAGPALDTDRAPASGGAAARPEREAGVEDPGSLVARFPGWARVVAAQHRRIAALERTVEGLSDRLAHDPVLAENLHDILSAVTSVRSTASILNQTPDIDPNWRARFHANLHEDSARLARTAQSLVSYFDAMAREETGFAAPTERVESYLAAARHHLPELESDGTEEDGEARIEGLARRMARDGGAEELAVARRVARRYASDAAAVAPDRLLQALDRHGLEPAAIAGELGQPLSLILRRLACLPPEGPLQRVGLVLCDGAGALLFRRRLEGFPMPQFGAACPLWPLYQALSRPHLPLRQLLETPGGQRVLAFAVAEPRGPAQFDAPPVLEATMLVVPMDLAHAPDAMGQDGVPPMGLEGAALGVGSSCRTCPRPRCPARREGFAGAAEA